MFINEVVDLVELHPLRDDLVGLPGVDGLSTEQRKRITIAVESSQDEWRDLCKLYERNAKALEANENDEDSVQQVMSKSETCKMSRKSNTLNHNMGQTSFDSYRYDYENLHKAHSDAITSGNDENTANDTALEQVFSRTTLLKSHGARGSKRKTTSYKFSVGPTQEQFDAMKKRLEDMLKESKDKQIESDSKVAYLTRALTTVMSTLQGHGLLDASIITQPEGGTSESDVSMD